MFRIKHTGEDGSFVVQGIGYIPTERLVRTDNDVYVCDQNWNRLTSTMVFVTNPSLLYCAAANDKFINVHPTNPVGTPLSIIIGCLMQCAMGTCQWMRCTAVFLPVISNMRQ